MPARPVNLTFLNRAPFFQNGLQAKSGFEMCFGPGTLGAGAKTRLESRIKEFTPHCVCRPITLDNPLINPNPKKIENDELDYATDSSDEEEPLGFVGTQNQVRYNTGCTSVCSHRLQRTAGLR